MGKLSIEWGDRDGDLIITKKKGKISFDELIRFMHEQNQLNMFDGDLVVIQFMVSSQRDMYNYLEDFIGEPEGDSMVVNIVTDDSVCPCCGEKRLFPAYCPDCGRRLDEKK